VELQNQVIELQKKVLELQKRIKNQDEQLQTYKAENQELTNMNLELQNQLQTSQLGNSQAPDYEAIRDRTLNKLKLGRQSTGGKAIDAFIKELQR